MFQSKKVVAWRLRRATTDAGFQPAAFPVGNPCDNAGMGTWMLHLWELEPLLIPHISWMEKIIRPLLVYGFLLVAFRFSGKRELSQATLFDFLILLLISNVVQNAMIGEDNSIGGSFAGVAVLLTLSWALNKITAHSPKLRKILEGSPTLLVHDGKVLDAAMRKESVSLNDLLTAFREQGIASVSEVPSASH